MPLGSTRWEGGRVPVGSCLIGVQLPGARPDFVECPPDRAQDVLDSLVTQARSAGGEAWYAGTVTPDNDFVLLPRVVVSD